MSSQIAGTPAGPFISLSSASEGADMNASERSVAGVRILTYPELKPLKGIPFSRQYLAGLEKKGKFPQRVPLGIGNGRIGWIESEIDEWLKDRAAARDSKKPPSA